MPARPSDSIAVWDRGIPSEDAASEAGSDLSAALDAVIGIFTGNIRPRFGPPPALAVADAAGSAVPAWRRLSYLAE
ncbi:hypothetical protein OHA37_39880 (plasmid) [Streptomyces sp. NBC_00335]|uniref:hypothetical protein n=1 Tax=unclassified Streptomyces TaxID=2593676 RepID=UPI0022501182|nr:MULTISPECIES: hypothetical protein [unclassified Streptomyces]MCX5409987.1 hypothetical protein [Streptomyces sp. NBC_00086]